MKAHQELLSGCEEWAHGVGDSEVRRRLRICIGDRMNEHYFDSQAARSISATTRRLTITLRC